MSTLCHNLVYHENTHHLNFYIDCEINSDVIYEYVKIIKYKQPLLINIENIKICT